MADIDALKAELKKLSARATALKMNLHDLSEELPINWRSIPEIAEAAFNAYRDLDEKRAELKQAESD